ncbi:MAG: DegT/DnrJ/EryC1/StrS family aminotransferase, partial [Candidatus Aminicenantes bacterium]|nr:DegT/DnrJ/EryC1/StrS family aminotransferase [Candidatus Aminicenantes bacterium]
MIRFDNFQVQYRSLKKDIDGAIGRVLARGWFILGEEVARFEEEFAAYIGTRYAVGVASGTEAIALSLMALDIGPGCEVITTAMTAFPTITGILQAGAKPVVVDICEETGLIDVEQIEAKINERTAAIVPVHLYGQSCDMDRIATIAG